MSTSALSLTSTAPLTCWHTAAQPSSVPGSSSPSSEPKSRIPPVSRLVPAWLIDSPLPPKAYLIPWPTVALSPGPLTSLLAPIARANICLQSCFCCLLLSVFCTSFAPQRPAHGAGQSKVVIQLGTDSLLWAEKVSDSSPGLLHRSQVRCYRANCLP